MKDNSHCDMGVNSFFSFILRLFLIWLEHLSNNKIICIRKVKDCIIPSCLLSRLTCHLVFLINSRGICFCRFASYVEQDLYVCKQIDGKKESQPKILSLHDTHLFNAIFNKNTTVLSTSLL